MHDESTNGMDRLLLCWDVLEQRYADPDVFMHTLRGLAKAARVPMYLVAKRMGTSPAAISRWGRGVNVPSLSSMIRMDRALYDILQEMQELESGL